MAEKTLNTRILLRYDSYENWLSADPVLKTGELAIAYLNQEHATAPTSFQNIPNVVLKVGNGTSKYSELKFVSGLAADVYSWAKAAEKPQYEAKEIIGLDEYISGEIQDTDTQYTVVPVEGAKYQYKLMSKALGAASFDNEVAVIDLTEVGTRLAALEEKVGDETVEKQITTAIESLDMTAAVEAGQGEIVYYVNEADGIVEAKKRALVAADIPALEISKVTGLQEALDAKQAALKIDGEVSDTNKVATQNTVNTAVNDAIAALDADDAAVAGQFVTAVSEADGKITVSRAALKATDIPAISQDQVTGLGDALEGLAGDIAKKQDALAFEGTYDAETNKVVTKDHLTATIEALDAAEVKAGKGEIIDSVSEADGVVTVTKRALKAEDIPIIAESQVDGLTARINAKQDALGFTGEYNKETNPVATKDYIDSAVSNIGAAMRFIGTLSEVPGADQNSNYRGGDVILVGYDEYVFDGSQWLALGNESIYKTKEEANQEHETIQQLISDLDGAKQDNLVFGTAYNAESNKAATMADAADAAADAISALTMSRVTATQGKIISYVEQADGKVTAEARDLVAADIPELAQAKITGLTDKLSAVDAAIAKKQDALTFDADHAYDATNNKVATMGTVTAAIEGLDKADTAVEKQFVTAVSEADGIITVSRAALKATDIPVIEQSQVNGLSTALAGKQDALQIDGTVSADNKVATQNTVTTAIEALDKEDAAVANQFVTAVSEADGIITVTRARPTAANIDGLHKIATTGNVNDLVQTTGDVLVFDCGNASTYTTA